MTMMLDDRQRRVVDEVRDRLVAALGDRLRAAVLYGPATHGEPSASGELALLVVVADLELATLRRLAEPFAFWRKKGHPTPRIFSPALLASSRDVFPLELLDLAGHREVLHGEDPVAALALDAGVDDEHLRIQCEREIVEKLMRLREGYAEDAGDERALRRLLVASFPVFARVLRGALRLIGQPLPDRDLDVARAFCRAAGLDDRAFVEVEQLRHGENGVAVDEVFERYYIVLERTADFIDRRVVARAASTQQGATQ